MKQALLTLIAMATLSGPALARPIDAQGSAMAVQAALARMAPSSKVACKDDGYGGALCTADGAETNVSGCGKGALYGAIAADKGVDLNDRIDGKGTMLAHLAKGQFVCVAATVMGDAQRHYVIAVPTASVPACKGNASCKGGDHAIQWKTATTGASCQRTGQGNYTGDCAAGWIGTEDLDQYANGL